MNGQRQLNECIVGVEQEEFSTLSRWKFQAPDWRKRFSRRRVYELVSFVFFFRSFHPIHLQKPRVRFPSLLALLDSCVDITRHLLLYDAHTK